MMEPRVDNGRKALGRGLAALIPTAVPSTQGPGLRSLAIERIRPGRSQPRKQFAPESLSELASSIEQRGVLQPIVVRQRGDRYELVAGERRWRAAQQAGLQEIPAIVKELSDVDALQVALIENLQRQDLDPLEEAAAYSRLLEDHQLTQEQVAQAVGKSRAAVANSLRLLKLPKVLVTMLADGRLTAGHARALMGLGNDAQMIELAGKIVSRALSVRDTEHEVRRIIKSTPKSEARGSSAEIQVEEKLQRALGTKVRLHHRSGKGKLEVYFHSLDQLDDLIAKFTRGT